MMQSSNAQRGFSKPLAAFFLVVAVIGVSIISYGAILRRFVRESLMQRVTSSHYEVLCPPRALSQDSMTEFAMGREALFTSLNRKLGDSESNLEVRVIFDPEFPVPRVDQSASQPYSVTGTTIRTVLNTRSPQLPAAADAEALLRAAWGKPGNAQIARWTAIWLVGDWHGSEIGMAAAQVEQRLGHKNLAELLGNPAGEISSADDHALLGAAWISEISEFGGMQTVRKLYATKMARPNVADATKALGTTPLELDRKWQLWMYSYLAGMPAASHGQSMPMDMPMGMPLPGNGK
jgi:hypothetical protein